MKEYHTKDRANISVEENPGSSFLTLIILQYSDKLAEDGRPETPLWEGAWNEIGNPTLLSLICE